MTFGPISFRDFWTSDFCDKYCDYDEVRITLKSEESKIIEDVSNSSCVFGPVCLFEFYSKPNKRFIKRFDIDNMEEAEDGTVYLIVKQDEKVRLGFTFGSKTFDFILTEDQYRNINLMFNNENLNIY